jgi:hypothetical protein
VAFSAGLFFGKRHIKFADGFLQPVSSSLASVGDIHSVSQVRHWLRYIENSTKMDLLKTRALLPNNADKKLATNFVQEIILSCEAYIKNVVTGWADKKPFEDTALFSEHRVKTIFVSTRRTNLKLVFHFNTFNFVIHTIPPLNL